MSSPKGGRHRNPADSRRRIFVAVLLAFSLSTAATSLWAVGSPLEGTTAATQDHAGGAGDSQASTPESDDDTVQPQGEDAAVQPQEAESTDESPSPDPTSDDADDTAEADDPEHGSEAETTQSDRGLEEAVLDLTNDERAAAGCGPLEGHAALDDAARLHAEDMADNDYFDHTSLDGRSPTDRAAEQGYEGGVGENIAAGYPDAAAVMEGWMNSEGHRANLLNCDYSVLGVGTADRDGTIHWVQNFG